MGGWVFLYLRPFALVDLLSSVPDNLGALRFIRVARLARLFRAVKSMALIRDELRDNRREGLFVIAVLLVLLSVVLSCVGVLYFESANPDATIINASYAVWWALATVTTVGCGDFLPTTAGGHFSAVLLMFAGLGLFKAVSGLVSDLLRVVAEPHPALPSGDRERSVGAVHDPW